MTATTLQRIDQKLGELEPESIRYQVLVALRRFRSSWVDLGRLLTEVAFGSDYKGWGYDDFEVYCARELGLKRPTVKKLMLSYRYMQTQAADRLAACEEDDGSGAPPEVPDYQTVELLHRAREREDIDENEKARFHRLAFDGGAEETALRKEIRSALSTPADATGEAAAEQSREREMKDIVRACQQLRKKLAGARVVPQGLCERFECLLAEIEALA